MKRRILSLLLALALFCTLLPAVSAANDFVDVKPTDWFASAVNYAVENKLMNGVGNGRFDPNGGMTRAMLVTVLWRFEGEPQKGANSFNDVPANEWYTKAVAWAAAEGVVNGVGSGRFDPNGKVTREQMATILYRYAQKKGFDTYARGNLSSFPDRNKASSWARISLVWVVGAGIINGSDGKLQPQGDATRAQVATILMRFIQGAKPAEPRTWMPRVAMITDYGNVDDQSFNQATYEAGKAWCAENDIPFACYQPIQDSTDARIAKIDQAVSEGYTVLLLPGYSFASAIVDTCEMYPDVKFIALDIPEIDLVGEAGNWEDFSWKIPANVFSSDYQVELAGYMAGYAAVKLGYRKLGFLGGVPLLQVVKYGYGFVQGADQAAYELGITNQVSMRYVYGNQFWGDANITAYMDTWYSNGTEVVFACGGGIYTSAAEAAAKHNGKLIGLDVDQAQTIDAYGPGVTVTSAMKDLGNTVRFMLDELKKGNWYQHGGKTEVLGIVSEDPAKNFVCLADSTQWNAGFTEEDYADLVGRLFRGELTVSADIEKAPAVGINVEYLELTRPVEYAVALLTDYGNVNDHSYNQALYEAGRAWCEENGAAFTYYLPGGDSTAARVAIIDEAVSNGYNVLLLPGYIYADAILEAAPRHPDVKFIGLDIYESDFGYWDGNGYRVQAPIPSNVFAAAYQEEVAGYMAGYAAVKLGYRKLGFLGGMAIPAVARYGYGYVQGADQAAKELGITNQVSIRYVYGNQFWGDADITMYTANWYASGTQVVMACGGGIYTSAAEAAALNGGKVIGIDIDQAPTIDAYGLGMTVTSAMKGLGTTVRFALEELIKNDNWDALGGRAKTLGIASEDPADAFVCLPDSTQWNAGFTKADYASLIGRLCRGELVVSANTDAVPAVSISVDYQGNIKEPTW